MKHNIYWHTAQLTRYERMCISAETVAKKAGLSEVHAWSENLYPCEHIDFESADFQAALGIAEKIDQVLSPDRIDLQWMCDYKTLAGYALDYRRRVVFLQESIKEALESTADAGGFWGFRTLRSFFLRKTRKTLKAALSA